MTARGAGTVLHNRKECSLFLNLQIDDSPVAEQRRIARGHFDGFPYGCRRVDRIGHRAETAERHESGRFKAEIGVASLFHLLDR